MYVYSFNTYVPRSVKDVGHFYIHVYLMATMALEMFLRTLFTLLISIRLTIENMYVLNLLI